MAILDQNIGVLREKYPALASTYEPPKDSKILKTDIGYPSLRFKGILFHSLHDPVKEARRIIEGLDLSSIDVVIMFGLGLGYHLLEVFKKGARPKLLLLVEPVKEIFWTALGCIDLREFIASPYVELSVGEDPIKVAERFTARFDPLRMAPPFIVEHPPSIRLNPEYFKELRSRINDSLGLKILQAKTLCRFGLDFQRNIIMNISQMIRYPGIKGLFGKFHGIPSIIIGAGPSLDRCIEQMKGLKEKALLIAADTSLKTLLGYGVIPHLVVVVDPQEVNLKYLEGTIACGQFLVVGSTAHYRISELFGPRFFFRTDHPICRWFSSFDDKGLLKTGGGSVVNVAFDLALRLGVNPIVLVGCDFSFPDGLIYTKGLLEDEIESLNKFLTLEMIRMEYLKDGDTITIPKRSGGWVKTNRVLYSYLRGLEDQISSINGNIHIINASYGAVIKGTEEMSLRELVMRWDQRIDIEGMIQGYYSMYKKMDPEPILMEIDAIIDELWRIEHLTNTRQMGCKSLDLLDVLLYSLCFNDLSNKRIDIHEKEMILAKGLREAARSTRRLFKELKDRLQNQKDIDIVL